MRTALTLVVCCVLTPGCGPDIYIEPGPTADGPCQSTCELDLGIGTAMCGQPFTIAENSAPMMIGSVDMNGFSELEMRVDLCDPKGWTVHISDAITDGWGWRQWSLVE